MPFVSFIVPAHNEQGGLAATLEAIHAAARELELAYEVIVVDDASTDRTPDIARDHGAAVVSVSHRQIAATRNAGAKVAQGDRLFFIDADTLASTKAVAAALRQLDRGAVGGAALVRFDREAPLYARVALWWLNWVARLANLSGGAFMFATREAYEQTGGFDERLYGAEDAVFAWALGREGRFALVWPRVVTSSRRVRGLGGVRMTAALVRMAFQPRMLTRRSSVEKVWYDSDRDRDHQPGTAWWTRVTNGLMLLFVLAALPVWAFLPRSLTPAGTTLGAIRWVVDLAGCHFALVLWPCLFFLVQSLVRQRSWSGRITFALLVAASLFVAVSATREVIGFWAGVVR